MRGDDQYRGGDCGHKGHGRARLGFAVLADLDGQERVLHGGDLSCSLPPTTRTNPTARLRGMGARAWGGVSPIDRQRADRWHFSTARR